LPKKTDREDCHHSRPAEWDPPTDKNEEPSPAGKKNTLEIC